MAPSLYSTNTLNSHFQTSTSSLISTPTKTLTHLRINTARQTHFPPTILIDATDHHQHLLVPDAIVPVYTSTGASPGGTSAAIAADENIMWKWKGYYKVLNTRPLSAWIVVTMERVKDGEGEEGEGWEDPVLAGMPEDDGRGNGDCDGATRAGRSYGEEYGASSSAAAARADDNVGAITSGRIVPVAMRRTEEWRDAVVTTSASSHSHSSGGSHPASASAPPPPPPPPPKVLDQTTSLHHSSWGAIDERDRDRDEERSRPSTARKTKSHGTNPQEFLPKPPSKDPPRRKKAPPPPPPPPPPPHRNLHSQYAPTEGARTPPAVAPIYVPTPLTAESLFSASNPYASKQHDSKATTVVGRGDVDYADEEDHGRTPVVRQKAWTSASASPPLAPGSPPLAGGVYTELNGPAQEVMGASLAGSEFLPLTDGTDDESDRWSVLSTGPVDKTWTVVFEAEDQEV